MRNLKGQERCRALGRWGGSVGSVGCVMVEKKFSVTAIACQVAHGALFLQF